MILADCTLPGIGGALSQRFKKWHTSQWRELKKVVRPALVLRHIVKLLVCFVSHVFASVSHPKFLFRFEWKQAKLGGQFRYFASKSFASLRLVSLRSEIRGHPSVRCWALSPNPTSSE